ncbi:uncharacterized protein CTHT_0064120 [Thermochaetoides thermophila DSM 1495]|uniref:Phosphatidic acid phosphatase type 2/haloperoxidase domain-containing protein n=1 Tax=Chaetomium thermophilum (strain DSM 1495 / CBS 144.50 / IMI 039719) TaxID=759272 RepID=G0SEL0_CHATD|nr:hypothetical protein CTHT_0064120 [Thermochaetoides thermophila DSM 1495]EGS18387.1 hypothetical protein CTHT_0064120 [Thermochaetoides thermophila DSM 1495]
MERSYASDYIGFISLFLGYTYLVFTARPFHRLFTLHDTRISFPHAEHERVPLGQALLYSLATPMIVMTIVNLLRRAPARNHHLSLMPFLLAMILTPFVTEVIKNAVGRPRPDLLARCIPAKGTPTDKLVGIEVCTQDDDFILQDGWRSFPSGHSSFAFCGLGYLSLWLCGQAKVFVLRQKGEERSAVVVRGDFIKAMVCGSPLIGAILIAVSRTQDYRHDVWDVSVGALLGFAIGWWSYRRYWPRLTSPYCNEPYAAPLPIEEAAAAARYGRVRDEEEAVSLGRGEDRNVGFELNEIRS